MNMNSYVYMLFCISDLYCSDQIFHIIKITGLSSINIQKATEEYN